MNQFISQTYKGRGHTQNYAVSNSSTGSFVLNYFSNVGSYRNRSLQEVWDDVAQAWGENPELTLKLIFYTRMISRKSNMFEESVRGQGNRDESQKAFSWVAYYHPEVAEANLRLFVEAGTWKDLWSANLIGYLDRRAVYQVVTQGIALGDHLLVKYLPRIRSASNTKNARHQELNDWARGLCDFLGWTRKEYRLYKSNPSAKAHLWQRLASSNRWNQIDFNTIPGVALARMIRQHGKDHMNLLERHNLVGRYEKWLDTQPVAKFNGYVYELFMAADEYNLKPYERHTFNKQFENLLRIAREGTGGIQGNVWCALDTSGSMMWEQSKVMEGVYAYHICLSLGIYFSSLNEGEFHKNVIAFSDRSKVMQLSGEFTDMVQQIKNAGGYGSTNFQSVIDEIVRIRRNNPEIPVEDYPETLLIVSDMQFNPSDYSNAKTNYETAMDKLARVGLPKMNIIWWQVNGQYGNDYPNTMDDKGVTMLSGFDGAILSLILGGSEKMEKPLNEMTPYEQMLVALDQPLLNDLLV